VFIADKGRLKEATVTLGKKSGAEVEVVSGLSAGQSVAVDNLDKLRDGQRIKS
jgi:multidrug efflux pump subunit AcrA (membrane-fusion protein)